VSAPDYNAILAKPLLTWAEVGVLLGDASGPMARSTLDELERRGVLPRAVKVGKAKFLKRADFVSWAETLK
jgi:hypothetical protein